MKRALLIITAMIVSVSVFAVSKGSNIQDVSTLPAKSQMKPNSGVDNNPDSVGKQKQEKYTAPYTGEAVAKETLKNTPFMVIVENSRDARPQSGLSEADIVFETMAEGGIPRFIALFQKNSPQEIGPVRSARSYFINISKEYGLPFGHCGGSQEALVSIKNEGLMSMNEMSNGSFYWRDKTRKAPHNLYTSAENLRHLAATKNFVRPSSFKHTFDLEYWKNSSFPAANNVHLALNKYYSTDYEFKDGEYYKSMDKTAAVDKSNNKPLAVTNIIVQMADMKLQPDGSHLDITLVGNGEGYVISSGKYLKIKWNKKDIESPTILTDENGKEVPLSPGKTWWHITDKNLNIQFK